ncbi:MAG: multiheme c-type cytochrome [Gemmatimonadota bacterium]
MPQQVKRLAIVFAIAIAALVSARHFLTPPTFGQLGHFRAAAIDSVRALPIHYAGEQACVDCHDDKTETKAAGRHAGVSCEVCHGPAAAHTENPDAVVPPAPRKREGCPLCHAYNPSRPTGFPQIQVVSHNPAHPCMECHDPHAPETPRVPAECGACHETIARTKAISHHAEVPCTQCHTGVEGHSDQPRLHLPGKPRTRSVCGECHARGAESPRSIPRVDMATHEPDYLCWQCHYPHHPEAQ